jgi:TRAP-type transport system periplasmic protein
MLDVDVAPLFGALVLTNDAWNKIPAADKPVVAAAAKAAEARLLGDAAKLDETSIATMKTRGLTVTTPDPKAMATFRAEADRLVATIRGTLVPADIYDAALRERDAYRKMKK